MTGCSTSNSHGCKTFLLFLFCVPLVFLLWGCSGDTSEPETSGGLVSASGDTGSASFAVQWHTADPADRAASVVRQAIADCESAGVASISCTVYDETNSAIAHGGPWNCSDHHGSIGQIPAGLNRVLAVLGTGAGGQILYQGQMAGITINPGKITDAGTIDARPFVPAAPVMDEVWGNRINLSWNDLGFGSYRIYRDGVAVGDSTTTSYGDTGLSQQTQYCYTISALDGFGHESGKSDQTCATTSLLSIWYRDSDNDTYGDPGNSIQDISTSPPEGYVANDTDCNDEIPTIHPGADESCNGIDDNCAGGIDENLTRSTTCGVGACTGNTGVETCTAGVWGGSTCDPYDGASAEKCDNQDNDCDGSVDEDLTRSTTCGVGPCEGNTGTETCSAGVWGNDTCDPFDGASNEVCFDGIDNDCSGVADEDCVVANEDCIAISPKSVYIYRPSDLIWFVLERNGDMQPLVFDDGEEAQQALDTIQYYSMNDQCFVGPREDPSMKYWLVDGSSPSGPFSSEDCIPFDPYEIYLVEEDGEWLLTDGTMRMLLYPNYLEAQQGLQTIQYYSFRYQCFVGRPNAPMRYWRR